MITIRISGRLGNQMFEYAAAWVQARRLGVSIAIDLEEFCSPRVWPQYQLWRWPSIGVKLGLLPALSNLWRQPQREFIDGVAYDPAVHAIEDETLLRGHFQSERYFGNHADAIRQMFDPTPFLLPSDARYLSRDSTPIAVHVRRTDYLAIPVLNIGDLSNYYRRCMEDVSRHVRDPSFLVFSDDPQWCCSWPLLNDFKSTVVSGRGRSNFNDLALMAECAHHIIPNSTFGWWGAWLARSPDKRVYLPNRWFSSHSTQETDLLARGWIEMEV